MLPSDRVKVQEFDDGEISITVTQSRIENSAVLSATDTARLKDYLVEGQTSLCAQCDQFEELGKEIVEINTANGWNPVTARDWSEDPSGPYRFNQYKIPAVIALITSELSEALEDFRKGDKEHFGEELADTYIRLQELATGLGIDLLAETRKKMEKNKGRGFRHGGKRV